MNTKHVLILCSMFLCGPSLSVSAAAESGQIVGVLAPTPVQEHSCVAVELRIPPGQPVVGLSWYHNDSTVMFPRLLLLEGQPGEVPDLAQTGVVLADLGADALDWGEVLLDVPVTSATGVILAVFEFPPWSERTSSGNGGGPGLGYQHSAGTGNAWVSVEGAEWIRLHEDYQVAVAAILGGAARSAGAAQDLRSLTSNAPDGWWTRVDTIAAAPSVGNGEDAAGEPPRAADGRHLQVHPNPFNPRTEVRFFSGSAGRVSVDVFDVRGRHVKRLVSTAITPGEYFVVWEGDDQGKREVASGVYFVRMVAAEGTFQQRVTLVR